MSPQSFQKKKRFYPHNTMVCTPLAQHPPAGQAATRSECGRRAHTWPWQYARATPQPPRARNCAGWNAVCPQWHKAPTKTQIHSTLLLAAAIRLVHTCAHDERCVRSRFDHGERMPSSTTATNSHHGSALHNARQNTLQAATHSCVPALQRRHARALRRGTAHASASSESSHTARSSTPHAAFCEEKHPAALSRAHASWQTCKRARSTCD